MNVNVSIPVRDQGQAPSGATGDSTMESIRPGTPNPIPLRASPHRVGALMVRFVGLLFLAVAAMALVYLR